MLYTSSWSLLYACLPQLQNIIFLQWVSLGGGVILVDCNATHPLAYFMCFGLFFSLYALAWGLLLFLCNFNRQNVETLWKKEKNSIANSQSESSIAVNKEFWESPLMFQLEHPKTVNRSTRKHPNFENHLSCFSISFINYYLGNINKGVPTNTLNEYSSTPKLMY